MAAPILTVSELNREARRLLEQRFPLLWVGGEISNLVQAASGHVYFSLKDRQAQVRCAMFRNRAQLLPWKLENGQQLEVQALVSLYEARGEFQLTVEAIRRAGIGQLYENFVRLREKLSAEGLFAMERKRGLPRYPRRIGIVTSPQAAALQDVIAALGRRAPHVELILYSTPVQGGDAPAAIVTALETAFARSECDLLLLVRGGGSLEDLWAFNDEAVARTLAKSPLPTISGIGHETDTTIADYVTDCRAATPTAAAELASAGWLEASGELAELDDTLARAMAQQLMRHMQTIDRLSLRLIHPAQRLANSRQQLEFLGRRLQQAIQGRIDRRRLDQLAPRVQQAIERHLAGARDRLAHCGGALAALSPLATLERGYSIARGPDGTIIRSSQQLERGIHLDLQFSSGTAHVVVDKTGL